LVLCVRKGPYNNLRWVRIVNCRQANKGRNKDAKLQ
jgi:hypothetical protein